jgi:hypothetical protein
MVPADQITASRVKELIARLQGATLIDVANDLGGLDSEALEAVKRRIRADVRAVLWTDGGRELQS